MPPISIVIPTLNEEEALPAAIEAARTGANVDITVVDGGSDDRTSALAAELGAQVLNERGGRGAQLNAGAAATESPVILFLHADTLPGLGYDTWIRRACCDPALAFGAFRLHVQGSGCGLRTIERSANWRSRRLHMPYGDQALFFRRKAFDELGGFRPIPIMEDYEMVRRARRQSPPVILPVAVTTSGRRWQELGVLRTTMVNKLMIAGYRCGVSPERLAGWYRGQRRSR